MTGFTEGRTRTFQASAALSQYRRVRLSTGKLAYAGATDTDCVGTLSRAALAADEQVAVVLRTAEGTQIMVASEAITQFASVYAAASGQVASSGSVLVGVALTAATAANDHIEVLPTPAALSGSNDLAAYAIPPTSWRVHNALATNLPATAADDDLALIGGTYNTDAPTLQGVDFGGTTTTAYARTQVVIPPEYIAGETLQIRVRGAMLTTVADTSCTVDVEAFKHDLDGAVGSDLCATAAQSINSLTVANKDFAITPTGLAAGDILDVRITIAGTDSGDAGVMIPEISNVALLADSIGY